jgi:hypothetical protein
VQFGLIWCKQSTDIGFVKMLADFIWREALLID